MKRGVFRTAPIRLACSALCLVLLLACGANATAPPPTDAVLDASSPVDIPFTVEPLSLPDPDGGAAPQGQRFVISFQVGGVPPIRGFLDTGSSGIVISPNAPAQTLAAVTPTQQLFSVTYGSGITATGVLGTARVTFGSLTTPSPIYVALVRRASGGNGLELQRLFNGYDAIVGIGLRNLTSQLGNPIAQLPGSPSYIVRAPDYGGTAAALRVNPTPEEEAAYTTVRLGTSSPPVLADGIPSWSDDHLPVCINDSAVTPPLLCAGAILDTGDPSAYLYWPGYTGPAELSPGSTVDVVIGPTAAPAAAFAVTVGASPVLGLDAFHVAASAAAHISLGTTLFFRFNVLFDPRAGVTDFLPHTGAGGTPAEAGVPCNVTYNCPPGTSCATPDGSAFLCMPDGLGQAGATCDPAVGAPPACGDHLVCLGMSSAVGSCTYWCDPTIPCPAGTGACRAIATTQGVTIHVCS